MFSLIPKTDAGLCLGPFSFQSTSSSSSIPGPFGQSWRWLCFFVFVCFSIIAVLTGSMAVTWTIIMHSREFRLLIQNRYLLSPALLSPHHTTPRNEFSHWATIGRMARQRISDTPVPSVWRFMSLCRCTLQRRGAFLVFLPTSYLHWAGSWWMQINAHQQLEVIRSPLSFGLPRGLP